MAWGPHTGPVRACGQRGALAAPSNITPHRAQFDGVRGAGLRDRPVTDA